MQFTVFALSSIPDLATARRLGGLQDLDDKSVAKVLFQRRGQQAGAPERLRHDQQSIAHLTLIRHAMDFVQIDNHCIDRVSEREILLNFYEAVTRFRHYVSWGGTQHALPLLHTRSLLHRVRFPKYWEARETGQLDHLDMREWNCADPPDCPSLNDMARLLGYPGMLGLRHDSVWPACLDGDFSQAQAYSELAAINTYLVALRVLSTSGALTEPDSMRAKSMLYETMVKADSAHFQGYLDAWDPDA